MLLLSWSSLAVASGPTFDLGTVYGMPGQQVTIPVTLTNNGASISALSIDIGFDATQLSVPMNAENTAPLAATRGDAITVSDETGTQIKNIAQSIPSPGILRLGVLGNNTIPIGDGVIANIRFNVLASASGTLVLTNNPGATSPAAVDVPITGTHGLLQLP